MKDEDFSEFGVNDSIAHEDFMIGTSDLKIVGTTSEDIDIVIFKDGEWTI